MNQRAASLAGGIGLDRAAGWLRRLGPAIAIFAIAFAVDMTTGQRYSSVWGSIAIVTSAMAVLPAIRPALASLGAYAGIWVAFNLVRAVADDAGAGVVGRDAAARWELALFGELPSAWLQGRLFDPDRIRVIDVALALVHASFFIVPFAVAAGLWVRRRALFRRYTATTAVTFAIGLVGFLLLPAAPPWLAEPEAVTRITHHLLKGSAGASLSSADGEPGFWFEPNQFAALPSIHVAATVPILLSARHAGRPAAVLAGVYALLMTFAVVYLGEHYLIDVLAGWGVAGAGWWAAGQLSARRYRPSARPRSSSNQARPG